MKRLKLLVPLSALAFILIIAIQYISINANFKYNEDAEYISKKTQKMNQANNVLKLLLDIETGARGYFLTGDKEFLQPYTVATEKLDGELKKLNRDIEPEEASKLEELVSYRVERAGLMIEKKKNHMVITIEDLNVGKKVMDEIRTMIGDIITTEEKAIESHVSELSNDQIAIGLILGSVVSLIIVGICIYAVINEFRKREKVEKDLKVSLAVSEAVSREIDLGLIACDGHGKVISANKWVTSKIPDLKQVEEFFATSEDMDVPVKMLLRGDIDTITEAELIFGGHQKILTINSFPFQIEDKQKGTVLSIIDTTEATKRMASLMTGKRTADIASKAKSDFLAKMSHEIRTPLNAILGVGEILSLTKMDEEQQRCLEIFKRSSVTLNNLVNDILDLSKIEAGKIDLVTAPFSLKNLVNSCSSIMDFRASQKGLLFTVNMDSSEDHFQGDEGRLRQIALNLLSNAIKFTDKGGVTFTIKTSGSGNKRELKFSVKDTGKGISSEKINTLFSDYQQENSTISGEYGGTGLGLSLSRELARLMGGDVEAHSVLGEGSEFIFTVPLEIATGTFIEEKVDENLKFNEVKILLVDDNPENRFIVKKYLNDFNIIIEEAVDGEDAVEKYKKNQYDLVLMDINMPKMDGITATKVIRKYEAENNLKKTVMIALSANAMTAEYNNAISAGCEDYLTKPVSRVKLITMIKKWLGAQAEAAEETEDYSEFEEEIDVDIQKLIPAYLDGRRKDIATMQEALSRKDIPVVAKILHNIKGTAASYGQFELDKLAKAAENELHANQMDEVEKSVQKMATLLGMNNGH